MPYRKPDWAVQQVTRGSGLVEDVCKHGVGHPNSDWLARHDSKGHRGLALHGCDGCCLSDRDKLRRKEAIEKARMER